jgi:hypothetical protein
MQALTPTLFPCYAAGDRDIATAMAGFIERGAHVRVLLEEGEMQPGEDLAAKAREARMADIVLVLFSRSSLPSPWPRARWEDALQKEPAEENVRIGFVRCDDCVPPRVLTPQFELAGLPLAGLRKLKRWVRGSQYTTPERCAPEIEALAIAAADRPGAVTVDRAGVAAEFARGFRDDFDAVLRVECAGRSLIALAGDLSAQLGLRLEGELEANLARLRSFCSERRLLLLLDGPAHPLVPGGRCSTVISTEPQAETLPTNESLRAIQYAFTHPGFVVDWSELCRLARVGVRMAREQGRLAETFELLQQWHAMAEARADRLILDESAREMVWILEGWDRTEEAGRLEYRRATEYDQQMALPIPVTSLPGPQRLMAVPPAVESDVRPGRGAGPALPRPEQFELPFCR